MIARCVVESGTSSYYSAIRDATDEPVLKEIAGRIAADEYRHYKLFYETLQKQDEPDLPFWRKLWWRSAGCANRDDDELAYAYYCANVPAARQAARSPMTARFIHAGGQGTRHDHLSPPPHPEAGADGGQGVGADPHGRLAKVAGAVLWNVLRLRAARRRQRRSRSEASTTLIRPSQFRRCASPSSA